VLADMRSATDLAEHCRMGPFETEQLASRNILPRDIGFRAECVTLSCGKVPDLRLVVNRSPYSHMHRCTLKQLTTHTKAMFVSMNTDQPHTGLASQVPLADSHEILDMSQLLYHIETLSI
jgi:hypothetical protein